MRSKRILETHVSNPYSGRDAKLYRVLPGPAGHGWEVVLVDGRWKTFAPEDYEEAFECLMDYIRTGNEDGFYDSGFGKQAAMWETGHPGARLMRELLPKKNTGLGKMLLVGGVVAAVGAWLWSKKNKADAADKVAALKVPQMLPTPPAASPTDLAPPADGGIIDVQGLGYYSTNRRQRIRRLPNR